MNERDRIIGFEFVVSLLLWSDFRVLSAALMASLGAFHSSREYQGQATILLTLWDGEGPVERSEIWGAQGKVGL